MKNCSIVNRATKEPKVVYKPDNGDYTTDYVQALKNTGNEMQLGYMQNELFTKVATLPKYDITTQEGIVQYFVENEMLKPKQIAKDTYEAVDSISAELIEDELMIKNQGVGFNRFGETFVIPKGKPIEIEMQEDTQNLSHSDLTRKYGESLGDKMYVDKLYGDLFFKNKNKVLFTENTLLNKINVFMNQMGISVTSIENYRKTYKLKNGVEPDAKALININERIVAFSKGEVTLAELSEEISHFIIEGLPQSEVDVLLEQIVNTTEYTKYAEQYRGVYESQVDSETAEKYTRKEVLGKMLSEYLQEDFDIETKTEVEKTIFNRLGDLVTKFLKFVTDKITPKMDSQIQTMFQDIKNRLIDENLNEYLNYETESEIEEMYSLGTTEKLQKLYDISLNIRKSVNLEKSGVLNTGEAEVIGSLVELFTQLNGRARLATNRLKDINENDGELDQSLNFEAEQILSTRNNLEAVMGIISNSNDISATNRQLLAEAGLDITRSLSDLNMQVLANNSIQRVSLIDTMMNLGYSDNKIETLNNIIDKKIKDVKWWFKNMGNISKSSNPLVAIYSAIVDRMFNKAHIRSQNDIDNNLKPLADEFTINEINDLIDGRYIKSKINYTKLDEAKDKAEYEIRKKLNLTEVESYEDYLESTDYNKQIKPSEYPVAYYKYVWAKKEDSLNYPWVSDKAKDYIREEFEKYKRLGITNYNDVLFKFLTNQGNTRRKYATSESGKRSVNAVLYRERVEAMNIFNSDLNGTIKKGLKLVKLSEAKGEYVELKSRKGWAIELERNAEDEAYLAFKLTQWNQEYENTSDETKNEIKENYRREYNQKLKEISNLSQEEQVKELAKWIKLNTQYRMNDGYWDSQNSNKTAIEEILEKSLTQDEKNRVLNFEKQMTELSMKRKVILDKTKDPIDSKEIDASLLTESDKDSIRKIEETMSELRKSITPLFKEQGVDMYKPSDIIASYNNSFYYEFNKFSGLAYEEATIGDIENFFTKTASANKIMSYKRFKNDIKKGIISTVIDEYKAKLKNPTDEDLLKLYMQENSPIYYRRTDVDKAYTEFVNDFRLNNFTLNDLKGLVENSLDKGGVHYKGNIIKDMEYSPNFRFAQKGERTSTELYQEYIENKDKFTTQKERYESLEKVLKIDDISDKYKSDFSEYLNDEHKLKLWNDVMEFKMLKMFETNTLDKFNIMLRPQFRKNDFEKTVTLITDKNKVQQLKESLNNFTSFRPDELNDSYVNKTIPLYGYRRINEADLTNDLLSSLATFSRESNLFAERTANLKYATAVMGKVFESTYDNKTGYDSSYHKMLTEFQQVHFFGRRLTAEAKVNVFGQERDIAKMAVWLKNFALGISLKLSPIVALTGFTTGQMALHTMKWVGDSIYSPSHDRAMSKIGSVMQGGVSDIGELFAENRLNKIGEHFNVFRGIDRLSNTIHGKKGRLLPKTMYSMMEMVNYPMVTQVMITKLMELRVIDGRVQSWLAFKQFNQINHPDKTLAQIKEEFEKSSEQSLWDSLDENGKLDYEKLKEWGATESLENIRLDAMSKIRDISEEVTGQLGDVSNPLANYNPWAQFVLSLKKWMVLATTNVFSNDRYDINRDGMTTGMFSSIDDIRVMLKDMRENHKSLMESYNSLEPHEQYAIRNTAITGITILSLMLLSAIAMKYADDDDDKDKSYALQLSALLVNRTLNEVSGASFQLIDNYYQALQQPVQTLQILKTGASVFTVSDIGKEVKSGSFEGYNKYLVNMLKLTPVKNLNNLTSADKLAKTRESYLHFTKDGSLYNVLDWVPDLSEESK